ncbi:MAG: hypothetical protein OXI50_06070, partial [Gammaproteobacteria bacterium]|nr:hypothetical protein [Gammaproteobacteria bacterium]
YGSWAKDLSLEELEQIYQDNGDGDTHLDEAFAEHFGGPLPDVVGAEQQFTIVASELDPMSDHIIEFLTEMVVPVEWLAARPVEEAFREKGLFASQVTACKLRDTHTIETVESAFGLNTEVS